MVSANTGCHSQPINLSPDLLKDDNLQNLRYNFNALAMYLRDISAEL